MEMTPEQALSILDQAAARAPMSRQEHVAVQQAVVALAEAIKADKPSAAEKT
jgi:hypothetical protein